MERESVEKEGAKCSQGITKDEKEIHMTYVNVFAGIQEILPGLANETLATEEELDFKCMLDEWSKNFSWQERTKLSLEQRIFDLFCLGSPWVLQYELIGREKLVAKFTEGDINPTNTSANETSGSCLDAIGEQPSDHHPISFETNEGTDLSH